MPKCDSIKLLCNFIEITLRHGCSPVNLLHISRTPFLKNTSEWLLLEHSKLVVSSLFSNTSYFISNTFNFLNTSHFL